ncbi:hypothetical protein G7Y89_g15784 [Cudoniella acicularis]|uniref:Uncharacterized protein n=1 Tax=Cudoniella acicularis TaxID=354080 RepID=A0A8H4VJ55_9HELO|nr:hypothetical protein G7Y89_g15784 [Cudoniella acicularis]
MPSDTHPNITDNEGDDVDSDQENKSVDNHQAHSDSDSDVDVDVSSDSESESSDKDEDIAVNGPGQIAAAPPNISPTIQPRPQIKDTKSSTRFLAFLQNFDARFGNLRFLLGDLFAWITTYLIRRHCLNGRVVADLQSRAETLRSGYGVIRLDKGTKPGCWFDFKSDLLFLTTNRSGLEDLMGQIVAKLEDELDTSEFEDIEYDDDFYSCGDPDILGPEVLPFPRSTARNIKYLAIGLDETTQKKWQKSICRGMKNEEAILMVFGHENKRTPVRFRVDKVVKGDALEEWKKEFTDLGFEVRVKIVHALYRRRVKPVRQQ